MIWYLTGGKENMRILAIVSKPNEIWDIRRHISHGWRILIFQLVGYLNIHFIGEGSIPHIVIRSLFPLPLPQFIYIYTYITQLLEMFSRDMFLNKVIKYICMAEEIYITHIGLMHSLHFFCNTFIININQQRLVLC